MSRNVKAVNVPGRGEVIVKEVSPLAVLRVVQNADTGALLKVLAGCFECKDHKLTEFYASEWLPLVEAFVEVNRSFLLIADTLRIKGIVGESLKMVEQKLSEFLPMAFVTSYRSFLDGQLKTSAGNSSSQPSNE